MTRRSTAALAWTACGLIAFLALWRWGAAQLGPLALPTPLETLRALIGMIADGRAPPALAETAGRVLAAFGAAMAVGAALGLAAGLTAPLRHAVGPLVTMLLAVPPIAWVVLALLWFGTGDTAVIFTTFIALLPIPFVAAADGVRGLDAGLSEMARAFGLSLRQRLYEVIGPHLLARLLPAAVTAFGIAWKVTVMAELLGAQDGVGSGLALSRANLDTAESLGWILLVVAAFLAIEVGIIRPLHRRLEPWRCSGQDSGRAAEGAPTG